MANRIKGEIPVTFGGAEYSVALGLGALAELEDAFKVDSFEEALDFKTLSATRLRLFLVSILKGNGVKIDETIASEINRWSVPKFMEFLNELMLGAGLKENSGSSDAGASGEAPLAGASDGASG